MKVSIGTKIKEGPWGGGNLFAINLKKYLEKNGHTVVHNLLEDDIDLILITEPRKTSESSAFTHIDVKRYLSYINNNALVVHRINECDERKGTKYVNKYLINANQVADQTIFVSDWLKNLYLRHGINKKNNDVIFAGADKKIFNNVDLLSWDGQSKLKFVTHHWGANWNKGFKSYTWLDNLISSNKWKDKLSFTYIGNIPDNVNFKNVNLISPTSGKNLANEIKKNHIYITGSLNEPSGNHHIEAAQCGLPILYINSGGMDEYCNGFGLSYENEDEIEEKIENIIENYSKLFNTMKKYPFDSDKMSNDYLLLFTKMLNNKDEYLSKRDIQLDNNFFYTFIFRTMRKMKNKIKIK